MILALHKPPYEIGATRKGCNNGEGVWHEDQPFTILSEVTEAEWIAHAREYGVNERDISRQLALMRREGDRFFHVAIELTYQVALIVTPPSSPPVHGCSTVP